MSVAHYFLNKNFKEGNVLNDFSNKKIQKLVYYAQAWNLVLFNKELFSDDFEAWVHGPAILSLYREFKVYGATPIPKESVDENSFNSFNERTKGFLDDILRLYGSFSANYLERLTHKELPWKEARRNLGPFDVAKEPIKKTTMQAYYSKRLKEARKK